MNAAEGSSGHLADEELAFLVSVAERSVRSIVVDDVVWMPDPVDVPPRLNQRGAAFVTLRLDGRLRGCIGTFETTESLAHTVADRARAAALRDPRFAPVGVDEVDHLEVEVSVLSAPMSLRVDSFADLASKVRPGIDGLIVSAGRQRATLLPAVWDDLPDVDAFLAALWRKAGLTVGAWPSDVTVERYTAEHWPPDREHERRTNTG